MLAATHEAGVFHQFFEVFTGEVDQLLVIAALVGTKGLGQGVYLALGAGDVGKGFVNGLSMALIAMIADRITQAWSARKKAELGLA